MAIGERLGEHYTYEDAPTAARPQEGLQLRGITGDHTTLVEVTARKGFSMGMHSHAHEQMIYLISGRVRINYENQPPQDVGPGEFVRIPAHVAHDPVNLEDTVTVETFGPARDDLLKPV